MVSFHVLIASIGRHTLQNLINSIITQLNENDHLTVVYDNIKNPLSLNFTNAVCKIHIYNELVNLGFWGHGIRSKYKDIIEKTDFVMHADDDDIYTDNTFQFLRQQCTNVNTLYIAKFGNGHGHYVFPNDGNIESGRIGTPSGIIPFELNKMEKFGLFYGGDGYFYVNISKHAQSIIYLDHCIYITRPTIPKILIDNKSKFTNIYRNGIWNDNRSEIPKSGPGSSVENTIVFRTFLDKLCNENDIKSIVDVGCGDLTWMPFTECFKNLQYTGIDIVDFVFW